MKSALLVIDTQVNMFEDGTAVHKAPTLLATLDRVISRARVMRIPIIYVQHNGPPGDPDEPDSPGWFIHEQILPREGDIVIQKHTPDAFHDTPLKSILKDNDIGKLVIMGVQTENCISTTCHHARIAGFSITLIQDGHSTFDSDLLNAEQIISHYNDVLSDFADVIPADQVQF
ncbi:MAG: cysteine hydrolase family protein [Gemmatimonadetes bacterium]|nr:cysteine hydrolase family protein [Gemmatimonadota bacterium]